ncbi:methyl-accepting chemotaxis protein [Bowmanella sp. Y26]|uniref:methyl-accepting chemotaxis protein n=1 Tax=Bowmanella yangjiangensis TaxID=2811230 RepID=UPI001BDDAC03|nr:methyl-accepting chemotaxis protein [Bowmanella yangjiangensis]MBT1062329.1 methyl-accepting chemotaxis protein [Bowmanella yangjiangensis]
MKLSIRTQLTLVAILPALIITIIIVAAALTDMGKMIREQAKQSASYVQLNTVSETSEAVLEETFTNFGLQAKDSLSSKAIPVILVLMTLLIACGFFLVRKIMKNVDGLISQISTMADPNTALNYRLSMDLSNELGILAKSLNKMMADMEGVMNEIRSSSAEVTGNADEVAGCTSSTMQSINHVNDNMNNVAAAINQLQASAKEIAQNIQAASAEIQDASEQSSQMNSDYQIMMSNTEKLNTRMAESAKEVVELGSQVEKINSILTTIQGIAEQTNLLALNAAIEAARAGEQGRGFAVVADEVRNLAGRTQQSTQEIEAMILALKSASASAVRNMEASETEVGNMVGMLNTNTQQLETLTGKLKRVTDSNLQIAAATEEQSAVINDINHNIHRVTDLSLEAQRQANTNNEIVKGLHGIAKHLDSTVNSFKVNR